MTQHEYVFIAVSVILGLAITLLLSCVAALVRTHFARRTISRVIALNIHR